MPRSYIQIFPSHTIYNLLHELFPPWEACGAWVQWYWSRLSNRKRNKTIVCCLKVLSARTRFFQSSLKCHQSAARWWCQSANTWSRLYQNGTSHEDRRQYPKLYNIWNFVWWPDFPFKTLIILDSPDTSSRNWSPTSCSSMWPSQLQLINCAYFVIFTVLVLIGNCISRCSEAYCRWWLSNCYSAKGHLLWHELRWWVAPRTECVNGAYQVYICMYLPGNTQHDSSF